MTTITATVLSDEDKIKERIAGLSNQVSLLGEELAQYRDTNLSPNWLQSKVARQAKALSRLNKRVRTQRLILRELNEHHPEIAESLFHLVSDKYSTELDDEISLTF